ncbi:hypothetical protein ACIBMX_46835 [Streptomyces phaeochromogenes]|uniref:hypothetical protein n=1 Tax=Streptomyces phaeochromogenes TaxID=1923 RepID=UPI0033EF65FA
MHTALHTHHRTRHRAALSGNPQVATRGDPARRSMRPAAGGLRLSDHLSQLRGDGRTPLRVERLQEHLQTSLPHRLPPPPVDRKITPGCQDSLHLVQPVQLSRFLPSIPVPHQPSHGLPHRRPHIGSRRLHHSHSAGRC